MWCLNNHPFVWGKRLIQLGFSLTGLLNMVGGQREEGSGIIHMSWDHGSFLSNGLSRTRKLQELGWLCLDVSGWAVVGQLGSWRSDQVLPSLSPLWPVCLDEELFGVETMPDGMWSLWGAEMGCLVVFNPTAKKHVFHPTNMRSDCISTGAAIRSVVSIATLLETFVWTSQDRDMGGIFGRDIDLHHPLMKGEEETSDGLD